MPRLSLQKLVRAILRGLFISIVLTLVSLFLLSLILLEREQPFSATKLQYIMIAITLSSVFTGSFLAARYSQFRGLIIGLWVGLVYAFLSIAVGKSMTHEELSTLFIFNKVFASILAGALGGLVGVNL